MHNEEKTAVRCIDEVIKNISTLSIKVKLVVINDGSSDGTSRILKEKSIIYKKYLDILTHKKNKGYGAATQTGISYALENNFSWCLHMDSDLTNDPKYIKHFVAEMSSNYDCIKASRYVSNGKVENVSFIRQLISTLGNSLASFLFGVGIKDCTNGFRMVKTEVLKSIIFKENNFSIILEELYYLKRKGARFKEIPYTLTARKNSQSHFRYTLGIFKDYFKYAFKALFLI